MKRITLNKMKIEKTTILTALFLVAVLSMLNGCAATSSISSSGVVTSQEATEIWHSYEVLPNYKYYISGPESRPRYIIGIDDKYHLTSKHWKPVDLTPEMLNKWFNYYRPRVGYSQDNYGAFMQGPDGQRIGLWYSMKKWRLTGSVKVDENNGVSVTRPVRNWG